jgi:hypothetical protein
LSFEVAIKELKRNELSDGLLLSIAAADVGADAFENQFRFGSLHIFEGRQNLFRLLAKITEIADRLDCRGSRSLGHRLKRLGRCLHLLAERQDSRQAELLLQPEIVRFAGQRGTR